MPRDHLLTNLLNLLSQIDGLYRQPMAITIPKNLRQSRVHMCRHSKSNDRLNKRESSSSLKYSDDSMQDCRVLQVSKGYMVHLQLRVNRLSNANHNHPTNMKHTALRKLHASKYNNHDMNLASGKELMVLHTRKDNGHSNNRTILCLDRKRLDDLKFTMTRYNSMVRYSVRPYRHNTRANKRCRTSSQLRPGRSIRGKLNRS